MLGLGCLKGVLEQDVLVERVILGRGLLVAVTVVEGGVEFDLLGQETAQVDLHGHVILVVVVEAALAQTLVHRAKAVALVVVAHVDGGDVAQAQCGLGLRGPAALVVEVGHTQLVDPHHTTAIGTGVVAHTNQDHAHVAQRRVTQHRHAVGRTVGVGARVAVDITDALGAAHLLEVALLLDVGEHIEVDVEHILLGPHLEAVSRRVVVVASGLGERDRHLVLVVVVLHITTQTDKDTHVAVVQLGVADESLAVDKHLQALIDAQVEAGVAVDAASVAGLQVVHLDLH